MLLVQKLKKKILDNIMQKSTEILQKIKLMKMNFLKQCCLDWEIKIVMNKYRGYLKYLIKRVKGLYSQIIQKKLQIKWTPKLMMMSQMKCLMKQIWIKMEQLAMKNFIKIAIYLMIYQMMKKIEFLNKQMSIFNVYKITQNQFIFYSNIILYFKQYNI
ncbi:hypothetical protein PPERSA_06799 [Pseudocohnilembus persalinus]|uniref:Uncharacterized protein n=1 Tax=Pseudocohnilembus persalinus TaxID=266149 RepID=A0A0V0QSM8_PSEPJ|nr:hypothetical protein PPERSA_06799 [Pseudocohnilembus persalinus]|eukprot:KRX05165.1 hypothetical protein PPERSA_06799 [Pseudocohnilembus persalinus]